MPSTFCITPFAQLLIPILYKGEGTGITNFRNDGDIKKRFKRSLVMDQTNITQAGEGAGIIISDPKNHRLPKRWRYEEKIQVFAGDGL